MLNFKLNSSFSGDDTENALNMVNFVQLKDCSIALMI